MVVGFVCSMGKLGVCFVILGLGVINLIIVFVDVMMDLVLLFVIIG